MAVEKVVSSYGPVEFLDLDTGRTMSTDRGGGLPIGMDVHARYDPGSGKPTGLACQGGLQGVAVPARAWDAGIEEVARFAGNEVGELSVMPAKSLPATFYFMTRQFNMGVAEDLCTIVAKATRKLPSERCPSMAAMLESLQAAKKRLRR